MLPIVEHIWLDYTQLTNLVQLLSTDSQICDRIKRRHGIFLFVFAHWWNFPESRYNALLFTQQTNAIELEIFTSCWWVDVFNAYYVLANCCQLRRKRKHFQVAALQMREVERCVELFLKCFEWFTFTLKNHRR